MAIEIIVPKLGWSMDEGTFVEWLKKDGDEVKPGDLLFALESDKAVQEIESMDSGILRIPPNGPQKDEVVKIGQVLGHLVAPGEKPPAEASVSSPSADVTQIIAPESAARKKAASKDKIATVSAAPEESSAGRTVNAPAVSPRAARLAMKKGVDLRAVRGTGRNGRITEKDVIAIKSGATVNDSSKVRAAVGSSQTIQPTARRKTIAERMLKSRAATVPVTLTMQVDASELINFRNQISVIPQS
ncbi:MAG: E3 binding domain-containing protein [Kiritimatiellae bacterium]|nr:E3 binding domain-containing protein [Verrucomicrobiota bacterium]MCG2660436.1 E3 binding domain-containing protein [Kiritimatiellia bacterium]